LDRRRPGQISQDIAPTGEFAKIKPTMINSTLALILDAGEKSQPS
jgi:hypothetical protein